MLQEYRLVTPDQIHAFMPRLGSLSISLLPYICLDFELLTSLYEVTIWPAASQHF